MKTLNETFDDAEIVKLESLKEQLSKKMDKQISWHDFIMAMASQYIPVARPAKPTKQGSG